MTTRLGAALFFAAFAVACRDPIVPPEDVPSDSPRDIGRTDANERSDIVAADGTTENDTADDTFDAGVETDVLDASFADSPPDSAPVDAPPDVPRDVVFGDGGMLNPSVIPDRRVSCGTRAAPSVTAGASDRFVLRGRVVTPTAVLAPGEVFITGGLITCVATSCAARAGYVGATVVETAGVIYPGLIDGHNHVAYDWLPEWTPPRLYGNRYQWQGAVSYDTFIRPYRENVNAPPPDSGLVGNHECAMAKYGEIRSLVAGTTTIQGGPIRTCTNNNRVLVRNVEFGADFMGVDHHRTNILGIDTVTGTALTTLQRDMRNGTTTTYIIHLAEGVDEPSRSEFDDLQTKMLLTDATVVVHGTGLGVTEHGHLGAARGRLVWSPRSNVILYGSTTNVPAAIASGVLVSLGPDWTPSGGPNLLSELRYARYVSRTLWGGLLTSRDLFEMVTSRAARVLDRHTMIGSLTEGFFADILVVPDTGCDPYDTLIDAATADVALVMIAGKPMYGDRALLTAMPAAAVANCEDVAYCGVNKRVCVSQGAGLTDGRSQTLADIDTEIRSFYPTPLPFVPICP